MPYRLFREKLELDSTWEFAQLLSLYLYETIG